MFLCYLNKVTKVTHFKCKFINNDNNLELLIYPENVRK